jgi:hypothetical protein
MASCLWRVLVPWSSGISCFFLRNRSHGLGFHPHILHSGSLFPSSPLLFLLPAVSIACCVWSNCIHFQISYAYRLGGYVCYLCSQLSVSENRSLTNTLSLPHSSCCASLFCLSVTNGDTSTSSFMAVLENLACWTAGCVRCCCYKEHL